MATATAHEHQHGRHDQQRVQRDRIQVYQRRNERNEPKLPARTGTNPSVTTTCDLQVAAHRTESHGRARSPRREITATAPNDSQNPGQAAPAGRAAARRRCTSRARRPRLASSQQQRDGAARDHDQRALRRHGPACQQAVGDCGQRAGDDRRIARAPVAPQRWRSRLQAPASQANTAATIAMCKPEIAIRWLVPLRASCRHCSRLSASCRPTTSPATMPADGRSPSASRMTAPPARAPATPDIRKRRSATTTESSAGTHVAAGTDVFAQHPRLVVVSTGVGETSRPPQLDFEFESSSVRRRAWVRRTTSTRSAGQRHASHAASARAGIGARRASPAARSPPRPAPAPPALRRAAASAVSQRCVRAARPRARIVHRAPAATACAMPQRRPRPQRGTHQRERSRRRLRQAEDRSRHRPGGPPQIATWSHAPTARTSALRVLQRRAATRLSGALRPIQAWTSCRPAA